MLRSEEQVHEKDQESILTQSIIVNRISTMWESLLLELFLVKGHSWSIFSNMWFSYM